MNRSVEKSLVEGCVAALKQGVCLLEQLDDQIYADASGLLERGGVGGHIRHCIDFYTSFIAGVREGRIDYNRRERDVLVERVRSFAIFKMHRTIDELSALADCDGDAPLLVSLEESPADTSVPCASTLRRELQFLLSHTVHHYALVALLLRLRGFEPGAHFGVAPSTLEHWKEEETLCAQ